MQAPSKARERGVSSFQFFLLFLLLVSSSILELEFPQTAHALGAIPSAIEVYGQGGSFTSSSYNNGGLGAASLSRPRGICVDSSGDVYIADYTNNRVLYYPAGSTTATRVYGQSSLSSNGANTGGVSANTLYAPTGVTLDSTGGLYVGDTTNHRALYYPSGSTTATRVYGQSSMSGTTINNGGISASSVYDPNDFAIDSSNGLYLSDYTNNRVLYYTSGSTTAARVYGQSSMSGNSAAAGSGGLSHPTGLALDSSGGLYITDTGNNRVLYYTSGSTTAARVYGQSSMSGSATGSGTTGLNTPHSVAIDASGNLYVTDSLNNRVLYYPAGSTIPTRVYGQGGSFGSTSIDIDGSVTGAGVSEAFGLALNSSGDLYFSDYNNYRVLEFQTRLSASTGPPASTAVNYPFKMVVQLIDVGSGTTFTDFTGNVAVSIQAGTGAAGAALSGTTTLAASAGVASFSNLIINTVGSGYLLKLTAAGTPSVATTAVNIVPGSLSVTFTTSPVFSFILTGVDTSGTTSGTFTMNDTTLANAGWNVTITSTQFVNAGGKKLPTSAMTITAMATACTSGENCTLPTNGVSYPVTVPAASIAPTAIKCFNAAASTGMGYITLTPTFALSIPANAYAGSYSSTITVAIISGP